ncbi:MAG: hypothetical protein Q8P39_02900, partial [Candidatus Yanofskybacteria bacterium]|nr:hypothetical protein [Candidatus Yanofskybacteria bacterium]
GKDYKKISIFAKNCSFFHGTCLKRRVSDIDSLLVSAHDLSKKHRKDVLQLVQSALERHSFSTQLPHQIPRIGNPENDRKKYHPILLKGEPSFSLKIHDDTKDVEKYQTRIKIKIILGELSHGDLLSLREKVMAEQVSWGEHFLKEIDELLEEKRFFEQYGLFIRKIETLLSCLGGFGVNANVILTINKEDTYSLSFILERLMRHGIIYINHDRLFINWDLRRPQHRWFIPITLAWKGKLPLEHITREALKGNIYTYPPFGILRNLSRNKIVPKRMIDLLSSESYLIIIEIFNALRGAKEQIRQPAHFSQEEIEDYVQIPNSNCEDVADRKLCLFGLLTGFAPKLSGQQIKLLARYNLFVQYLCHPSKIQIHKTRFFKRGLVQPTDSPKNFATKFKEDFTRALREYYLYQKCHLSQFLLEEKRKELLFMYFVRGRGLMEGPLNQSQEMQEFLCSIHLDTLFEDSVLTRVIIERFAYIVPDLSENYALFHVLKNLRMKQ